MDRRNFLKSTSLFVFSAAGAKLLASCSSNSTSTTPAADGKTGTEATETAKATNVSALDPDLKTLEFGIISTESQANQKPLWEPFVAAMSEELGIPVKASYATSYAGVIEAMRFGKVHLAWLGGKSYIGAAKMANAEAFARTVALDGSQGYYAHLIANKDNPIVGEIKDGKGDLYVIENADKLTFAFNDPNSTSGFLVPSYYVFAKNDVNPKKAFEKLVFSGSHEATALAVANNQVDVATNNSESLSRLEKTAPEARKNIEIIWTSVEIPSDPIAYRKDLPEEMKQKIRDFFYNYKNEEILGPLEWSGFVPAGDADWNPIRELEVGKEILEVQSDEKIDEATREQKLTQLRQKLEALQ